MHKTQMKTMTRIDTKIPKDIKTRIDTEDTEDIKDIHVLYDTNETDDMYVPDETNDLKDVHEAQDIKGTQCELPIGKNARVGLRRHLDDLFDAWQ